MNFVFQTEQKNGSYEYTLKNVSKQMCTNPTPIYKQIGKTRVYKFPLISNFSPSVTRAILAGTVRSLPDMYNVLIVSGRKNHHCKHFSCKDGRIAWR